MRTLVLVRHAKSDWGDPALDDHDRPLNDRGLRDARLMASRLAARGVVPERILSSTALRARTTAGFFGGALGVEPELRDELYGAPARVILDAATSSDAASVIVVAHDPGMSSAVARLTDGEWDQMPTCAVAVFSWETDDWETALDSAPDSRHFDAPR